VQVPLEQGFWMVQGVSSLTPPAEIFCSQIEVSPQSSPVLHEAPSQEVPQSCRQLPSLIVETTLPSEHAVTVLKSQ
jgi:hypothetical protein